MVDMADKLLSNMGVNGTDNETESINERQRKVIEMLNSGMSQQEITDSLKTNKGTISRDIKFIQKNYPDKLATQKSQTISELIQTEESTPKEEKTKEKANIKPQKQSFSFRADQNKIENWKLYAEAVGTKDIGTLWTTAIDEYISNHKLTENQQEIYNLKKKAAEIQKNQK